ncbi:MAG: glycosyltransferase, partial [Verrucomicrobia bacterium]|nr:glycosyltransferase [Verrucomicrobiota bacterium]
QMTDIVEKFCHHTPQVRRIPFLHNPQELADWYRAADLLVHPGRWETFGLVSLEAQGCGLPTVAFRGGAMDEQAADRESWTLDRSSSGLAEAVAKKIRNLKTSDREKAADFVRQNYSWQKTFTRQMKVYANE